MFFLKQLFPGALTAFAVSAVLLAIAAALGKKLAWTGALILGIGYIAGHLVVAGVPPLRPAEATQWLPHFAVASALASSLVIPFRMSGRFWAVLVLLINGLAMRVLLASKVQYGWSRSQAVLWICGLALLFLGLTLVLDLIASEKPAVPWAPSFPEVALLIQAAGLTGALLLSGSFLLGQLAAVLCAALAAGCLFPRRLHPEGNLPIAALLLGSLSATGYFYADLPASAALLILCAPALKLIPVGKSWNPMLLFAVKVALVALPVSLAVLVAFKASPPLD